MNEKGETFFVGKDVAKSLGYTAPRNALATHEDEEDKTTALIQCTGSNYKSKSIVINESGPYFLLSSMRKVVPFPNSELLTKMRPL